MRNNFKKWVCVAVALLVLIGSTVYAMPQPDEDAAEREIYQKNDFIYEVLGNNTVTIHFYTGEDDIVVVPSEIDGCKVKMIESHAFYEAKVKDVIISEGITTLADEAFYNCQIETLQLPSSLENVGNGVFRYCRNLKEVYIPKGASLGKYMFYGCTSLKNVSLPSDVYFIEDGMFAYCTRLENIKFQDNLRMICDYAFYSSGLKAIELPVSLSKVGAKAFARCTNLASITAVNGDDMHVYVEEDAFSGCAAVFPEDWNVNDTVVTQPTTGYAGTDETEPTSGSEGESIPAITVTPTVPPPVVDVTTEPTIECTLSSDPTETVTLPIVIPPSTVSTDGITTPFASLPITHPTYSETPMVTASVPVPSTGGYVTAEGFYIGTSEDFLEFEDENALSAKDAVAKNKKELLELAWNVRTRGDVNEDNSVNVKDATAIQKYCAGMTLPVFIYKNADVNTDGKVNVKDATTVQKFIAGIQSI